MPDNLSISISADTGKARADLELLKGKLQELGREMRAARAEALKTGDRTNLDRLAREYDTVTRSAQGLQRQLRATNAQIASPAWSTATKAAAALNAELVTLARSSLGVASSVGGAVLGIANLIGKTADQILELRRMSQSTGFSPGVLKAVNETLEDIGSEAGAGNKALIKLSQAFAQVRQDARAAGDAIGSTVKVIRGSEGKDKPEDPFGVDVFRGGKRNVQEIKSAADAFKVLRVDMRKFKDDAAGNEAALQAIIDGFGRLAKAGRIDEANLAAMQLFGKGLREILPALKALSEEEGGLAKAMNKLREEGRFPDADAEARALAYQKALKDLGDTVDRIGYSFLQAFGPTIQGQMKTLAGEIETLGTVLRDVNNIVNGTWNWPEPPGWLMRFLGAGPDMLPPADFPPLLRAGGGMIHGPGSGTSDSILARLSNGEFVMRARAVDHWGPQFMAALNSLRNPFGYAGGGLVRAPRFADGGMVSARMGDGTVVNLHFPGGSFQLRGDREIVGGLTREARRAGMLNAGRLPGAFA